MKITNQMFRRNGKWYTRCWDIVKDGRKTKQVMYEIETDPATVRPQRGALLWKPEDEQQDTSLQKAMQAAGITGLKGGFSI